MIVNSGENREIEESAVEMMLGRRVEGIIYAAMYHRPVEPPANSREVPAVLLDCYSEDGSWSSVVPDEVSAVARPRRFSWPGGTRGWAS